MTMFVGAAVFIATVLGAAWRRWYGSALGSGHGMRFVKHLVGFVLVFGILFWALNVWYQAAMAALVFSVGMSFGHLFEEADGDIAIGPLALRYGAVSAAVATCLSVFLWNPWAALYGVAGTLTPLGYLAGKVISARSSGFCWSCLGECFMGAVLVGPLPLYRLF